MQKINEDENKVNLIKCPLPKIIYMTMKGLTTFENHPEKSSNITTYYTKKINHQNPGLPSLKMSTKLSFSPNITNYVRGTTINNLNNNNSKKTQNFHSTKINVNENNNRNNNKKNKKQSMKEILNNYGLNRYYEKLIQNGINEENFNQIGLMSKKQLNEFINILNIFPSHIIKMEQLYLYFKKYNSDNFQSKLNNSGIKINNSTKDLNSSNMNNSNINNNNNNNSTNNNSNNVNYVTLTFNRGNLNNLKTRVSQSQNKNKSNKYYCINPTIKQKKESANRASSEKNKSKNKAGTNHSQRTNRIKKNKSKKKLENDNIISKYNFAPPKHINPGRNDLIKFFFKDLDNMNTNTSTINSGINNLTNLNLFKSHNNKVNKRNLNKTNNNSLTGMVKELIKEKKINTNIFNTKYKEKHSAPDNNNYYEVNQGDLPKIQNLSNRPIKIKTHYNKSLINSMNENFNAKKEIEMKTGYNKPINQIKANNDNKKIINTYQIDYNVKTFFNDNFIKNMNKKNNTNYNKKIPLQKKNSLKNSINSNNSNISSNMNLTHASQKSHIEIVQNNKNNNNNIKIKLPNVIKKTDSQNNLQKSKPKNNNRKNLKEHEEGNKNISLTSSDIIYKNEKQNQKIDNYIPIPLKEKKVNETNDKNQTQTKEVEIKNNNNKLNMIKIPKMTGKKNSEENKKEIININIEEKNQIPLLSKETSNNIHENISKSNNNINDPILKQSPNIKTYNNNADKNIVSMNNINIEKNTIVGNISKPKLEQIEDKTKVANAKPQRGENLEDNIYESLRLNRSFSENRNENIYLFDLEFLCRCLGLCLAILIETSKESPHITEINLEALSAAEIKYFFFNDTFNDNINFLFDLFDKEVNTDINMEQISPLDKLEFFLSQKNYDNINFDVSYLKHIKKDKDEVLIKAEEEIENEKSKEKNDNQKLNNVNMGMGYREGFKIRTGFGDIEKDIKFIDEFFSMNNRRKKKAKNYNFISDMSKNILCKELSYINEIDSELNGTNSNINNTNLGNNSNNNINEKILKEENASNLMDNEEIKEIKEIQNNNAEEENNNTFNNEMNELGIIAESNDDKNKNNIKNTSNNSIHIKPDEINDIIDNRKESDTIILNEENKNISLNLNNEDNNNNTQKNNDYKENIIKNENKEKEIDIHINDEEINNQNNNNNIIESNSKNNPEEIIISEQANKNEQKMEINQEIIPNPQNIIISAQNDVKNQKEKNKEEDDVYESDYILDIASIDELTYYLIKRAEVFDEDFNYVFMKITERRYIPIPEPQTIFDFMADIIILTKMEKEVVVLSLIYIERLIFNTGLLLTSRNWRRILLTAMIISSKIWDDNSFENDHFSQVFANLGVNEINTLERIFLELINYKVYVKQSEYFKYLMMIKIIALKYNYNGREIVKASIIKNLKYQEFNETMQNRMRKKVTLNNSAQF